ncbi:MAG: sce7726 family protein [Lachnospiraceae bacterium]|nr:sce7726 family protein [Lachnospiraceae bacterium]
MLYDRDIREPLFEFLEEYYGKVRIIEEKRLGRSRADVVMILPHAVCGLEIKSDADTYARLKRQVKDYNQYCDYNFIVAGTTHAHHVAEHVPEWWGIITVELEQGKPDFYVLRKPGENPKVDWKKKMSLLWRPELVHIQELNQMPRYREKSKQFVIEKILLKVPREKLSFQISQELFERDYTQIEEQIRAYRRGGG